MKKLFKILLILFGVLVALVIAASIALRILLPPEKAKALVLKHLSDQLKREVTIGNVSVGVISGLEITDLKISESPTFARGTFISSDHFSLQIALVPLLSHKVVVRQIVLKKPTVTVIRKSDGKTFNFSDLTETAKPTKGKKSEAAPAAGKEEGTPFTLVVSRAEIEGGALHFIDLSPAKQSVDIAPFDLKLKGVSLTDPFSLQLGMKVKYRGSDLSVRLGGKTNLLDGTFQITEGSLASGPMQVTLSGMLSQLKTEQPAFKMHLETNEAPVRELLKYSTTPMPAGVVLDGTTKLAVDVSGTAADQQFASKWTGTGMRIASGENFEKPVGVPLELTIIGSRAASGVVSLKNVNAKLSESILSGTGMIEPQGKDSRVSFSFKGTDWSLEDLAKLSPAVTPFKPSGTVSFDGKVSGMASAPQTKLNTNAKVKLGKVIHPYYEGEGLELNWNISDITPDLSQAVGAAHLSQGVGKLLQVEKLAASSRIGKIALAPLATLAKLQKKGVLKQVKMPSFDTVPFDSLLGDYALKGGQLDVKTFNLEGKDLSVQNKGRIGLLGAQAIQMNVAVKLAADAVGGSVGQILNDESGRPTVKFLATGSMDNPQVKFDLADVKKKAGEEIMKNKDVQKAVGDVQKALENIFKR